MSADAAVEPGSANPGGNPFFEVGRRIVVVAAWMVLGALLLAVADVTYARAATGASGFLSLYRADVSVVLPVALLLSGPVAVCSFYFHTAIGERSWLRSGLYPRDPGKGRRTSARLVFGALAGLLWLLVVMRFGVHLLASELEPSVVGLALGFLSVGTAVLFVVVSAAVSAALARRYPKIWPRPIVALGIAAVLVVGSLAMWIAAGDTSGAGGTFKMFGVLRRAELDLRAPTLLFALCLFGYLPPLLLRIRARNLAFALLPLALVLTVSGRVWSEDATLALDRGAPLAKRLGPVLRAFTDKDGDGVGTAFGGNDCDDAKSEIYPGALDVPENGIDEDCSGADSERVVFDAPEEEPSAEAAQTGAALPDKPNVVFITIDTLRYDLGYMGHERPLSKELDALAAKSVVFDKAYALASYTGKSVGPMLIGKYTSETHRGWRHFNKFGTEDTFIQERLQQAGIHTVSVQAHWYFKADTGLGRGFDILDMSAKPEEQPVEGDKTVTSDKLSDAAISHLERLEEEKKQFFMWVHYLDPHADYVKHEDFYFGRWQRDLYEGEIAFTDHHVGRVLKKLEQLSLAKNTIVVVTSDHGEAFGEHGLIRHGFELWEELVRVPLIVYVPGAKPMRHQVRRSAIDIVPTLLDIYGLDKPNKDAEDFISGTSFLTDLLMPEGHEPKPRRIFIDMSPGPYNDERQAYIEDDIKLIAAWGRPIGLYNLKDDPGEKKELLKDKALREKYKDRYNAFRMALKTVHVARPK